MRLPTTLEKSLLWKQARASIPASHVRWTFGGGTPSKPPAAATMVTTESGPLKLPLDLEPNPADIATPAQEGAK